MFAATLVTILVTSLHLLAFSMFVELPSADAVIGGSAAALGGLFVGVFVSSVQKKYAPVSFSASSLVTLMACLLLTDREWNPLIGYLLVVAAYGIYEFTRYRFRLEERLPSEQEPVFWFFFPWLIPAVLLQLLGQTDLLGLYAFAQAVAYALHWSKTRARKR